MPAHAQMTGVLGIPMDRMGSGTTWIPDAVALPSAHFMPGQWTVMLHGFAWAQYITQSGPRGDDQFGSLNWAMLMGSRPLLGGVLQPRVMLSLDPWTVSGRGYPLLLQTGEVYQGTAIRDRQHPHDFWMELGVLYDRPLTSTLAMSLYAGPSAEPALGAVAFMHRPSAMDDPIAPLSHHWHDATHISYGVVTAGLFTRRWKLEGSWFNGREPDDRRFAIDPIRLDSWSGRLTVNPSDNWSLTAGYGYLHSPESLHPDESQRRVVASAMHAASVGARRWSSAFVAGANRHDGEWVSSWLVESRAELDAYNTVFGRAELTHRSRDALGLAGSPPDESFHVAGVSLGYVRELLRGERVTTGLGVRGTLNVVPAAFESDYGSRTPTGAMVFLRVRPVRSVSMPM